MSIDSYNFLDTEKIRDTPQRGGEGIKLSGNK